MQLGGDLCAMKKKLLAVGTDTHPHGRRCISAPTAVLGARCRLVAPEGRHVSSRNSKSQRQEYEPQRGGMLNIAKQNFYRV